MEEWEVEQIREGIATFRLDAYSIHCSFTFLQIELIYKVSLTSEFKNKSLFWILF